MDGLVFRASLDRNLFRIIVTCCGLDVGALGTLDGIMVTISLFLGPDAWRIVLDVYTGECRGNYCDRSNVRVDVPTLLDAALVDSEIVLKPVCERQHAFFWSSRINIGRI